MDALDLKVLRALGLEAWADRDRRPEATRATALAKRFGVRDELVRERIARMEEAGVIRGYEVYPNFRQLGLEATTFHYRLPDDAMKTTAIDEAAGFEGVFGVYGYLGPHVCVDICTRTPAERARRLDVLGRLMGGTRGAVIWERKMPVVDRELDLMDWRVIQRLRGDAHRPFEEVARDLDVSERTVRRRVARLAAEGSIDVIPNVDPTRVEGGLSVEFHVHFHPGREVDRGRVLEVLSEHWFSAWTPPDAEVGGLVAVLVGPSIAHFEALRGQVEALEGVRSVAVLVPSRAVYDGSWIDEAIEERVQALTVAVA